MTVSPVSLSFTATQGAANPASQTVAVTSNGTWTVSKNATWLTVSPLSGANNGIFTASVNTATAVLGNNNGMITVTGGGITRTANVTLTLNAPATSSATLTWTANTESDLAGYKVYRATASGAYGAPIATLQGNVPNYVATGLQNGTTYFFVITAYDTAGNESGWSNEISKSIF
jgi:chitodextrinase